MDEPLVLLTNDDGFGAAGLEAMAVALGSWARVVVLAPETEQSACSHKISLHQALRLRRVGKDRFALDGTPADCVYVGLYAGERVMPRRPDLVVSGLNRGLNLGLDVYYSGTVAAAREAAIRGVPGLAVSADMAADLTAAASACAAVAKVLVDIEPAPATPPVINVNVPARGSWTLRSVRLGRRMYGEGVDFRRDPRGRSYLWLGGPGVDNDMTPGTDTHAFERGEIGVSSLPLLPHDDPDDVLVESLIRGVGELEHARSR